MIRNNYPGTKGIQSPHVLTDIRSFWYRPKFSSF